MTEEQKKYIEANIDLIDEERWKEFFKNAPKGIGGVLYEVGIHFLEKLRYVPNSAFYDSNIQTIDIPERVTRIGNYAFYKCSKLTSITIPKGVTIIGNSTFAGCKSLKSIVIPDSVTRIEGEAFIAC